MQYEIVARQTENTLRDLRVASNPHIQEASEQRAFVDQLLAQRKYLRGIDDKPELDRKGLDKLKGVLKDESRSGIAVK